MSTSIEREAVARIGSEIGHDLRLEGDVLTISGTDWPLPEKKMHWDDVRLRHAFPSSAHGDQREKIVYKIVQDASSTIPTVLDAELRRLLPENVPLADGFARRVIATAMADEYWTVVQRIPYLVPYHSSLPSLFLHTTSPRNNPSAEKAARYKMFPGIVLPFLCWRGTDVDSDLVQAFLDVMNSTDDFTRLDELLFSAARSVAGTEPALATADELVKGELWPEVESTLSAGAFWQPTHDRFQEDLRTVLSMQTALPRRDLIDLLTLLLSFHLALHYYRVAVTLGDQLDRVLAVSSNRPKPPEAIGAAGRGGLLTGQILFRVGTRGDRPVRASDPCATSYRYLTDRRLLALPAVITTMNLTHSLWNVIGGAPSRPDLPLLLDAIESDAEFAEKLDAGLSALAALYYSRTVRTTQPDVTLEQLVRIGTRRPGLFALRESITARRRTGLRNLSRDVVNQLVKRERGGLIRTRGNVIFFELDEDALFLLVKVICREDQLDFTSFLEQLAEYGLAPQEEAEKNRLIAALERLGMLRRYADAGESIYVSHPIA